MLPIRKALIAFEASGVIRRAMAARGIDAWSIDLLPAEDRSNKHIIGDVRDHLDGDWDFLGVFHPPCTVMCNSGVKHLYIGGRKENGRYEPRWIELEAAAELYRTCRTQGRIPVRAIENPIMHSHAIRLTGRGYTQFVQPWWFGDPFFKATGFELINLPKLKPTNKLTPPKAGTPEHKAWSAIFRAPPGPDRWKFRSRTFPGIANAIADQWGGYAETALSVAAE
jgi:hypothetical protein